MFVKYENAEPVRQSQVSARFMRVEDDHLLFERAERERLCWRPNVKRTPKQQIPPRAARPAV